MFELEYISKLNELEIIVYNYIIENSEKVISMSIQELAKNTHVSTTTILRFCRSLNLNGYSELKIRLKDEISSIKGLPTSSFYNDLSFLEKYSQPSFQKKIDTCSSILEQSSGLVWMGFGASAGICKYAANYFSNTKKFNLIIDDPYFHCNTNLFDGAVLIVLSVSGEIDNTIRIIKNLKSKKVTIVSITNYENSTLAKLSDYTIPYYITYNKNDEVDMTTQLPVLMIIEMLGSKLMEKNSL